MRSSLLAGFAVAGVLLAPGPGHAAPPATLTQALVDAYYNNATLQEQRASLRATDEDVPTRSPAGGRRRNIPTASAASPARPPNRWPTL